MKYLKYYEHKDWTINYEEPLKRGDVNIERYTEFYREFSSGVNNNITITFGKKTQSVIDIIIDCRHNSIDNTISLFLCEDWLYFTKKIEKFGVSNYRFTVSEDLINSFLDKISKFYECCMWFIEKIIPLFNDDDLADFENINNFELLMEQFDIKYPEYEVLIEPLLNNYDNIKIVEQIDEFIFAVEKIKNHEDIDTFLTGKDMGLL